MNLFLHLLTATVMIAVMVLLRLWASRRVIQQKLSCDPESDGCREIECFHPCGRRDTSAQRD